MNEQKPQWTKVKEITHQLNDGKLTLQINKLALRVPRYSFCFGMTRNDAMRGERFTPFFTPQISIENYTVALVPLGDTMRRMMIEAESFVAQEAQELQNQMLQQKQAKEQKQLAGPPQYGAQSKLAPRIGKTARDKQKPGGQKTNDPRLSQAMRGSKK